MPGAVASAPTARGMLLNALRDDAPLHVIMRPPTGAGAAAAIVVASGATELPARPPFVLVRLEGAGVWAIECHDLQANKTATIDRMVSRIQWRFTHAPWATPTETYERPLISECFPPTGELTDDGFTTIKRIVRVAVTYRQF